MAIAVIGGIFFSKNPPVSKEEPAKHLSPTARRASTIAVGMDNWPGYAGAYLAQKFGYCREEGIECYATRTSDTASIVADLKSGKYDVAAGLSTAYFDIANDDPDQHFKIILASDQSIGADGIVARKQAPKLSENTNPRFATSFLYQFIIGEVMKRSNRDISAVSFATTTLPENDALELLYKNKADYHATYEPYLSEAKARGLRVEYTSAEDPGIITDVIVANSSAISQKREAVAAFVRAYFKAVEHMKSKPEEAINALSEDYVMAPNALKAQMKYIRLLSAEDNRRVMQMAAGYQSLPNILRGNAITRAKQQLPVIIEPETMIDKSFIGGEK